MNPVYILIAISVGVAIAMQSAVNNQLKNILGGSTMLASMISFIIGSVCLVCLCAISGERFTRLNQLQYSNSWQLTGGALGAFFVFGTTFLAPRIGIAAMISLVILGQIVTSLILDKYGFLGLPIRDISPTRLLGTALVLGGVLCVNYSSR